MNSPRRQYIPWSILLPLICLVACQQQSGKPQGTPVAQYGIDILTAEEVGVLLPDGISKVDSQARAQKLITKWLKEQALTEAAQTNMPGISARLDAEAAAHRRAIAGHYLSEHLVEKELNTKITPNETEEYFRKHSAKFIAEDNYYAYFHVRSEARLPNQQVALMRSDDRSDIDALKQWTNKEALESKLDSIYVPEGILAPILEGTYLRPQSLRANRTQTFRSTIEGKTYYHVLKLIEKVKAGEILPLSVCRAQIEEVILTHRKQQLIEQIEARYLQKAQKEGKAKTF